MYGVTKEDIECIDACTRVYWYKKVKEFVEPFDDYIDKLEKENKELKDIIKKNDAKRYRDMAVKLKKERDHYAALLKNGQFRNNR